MLNRLTTEYADSLLKMKRNEMTLKLRKVGVTMKRFGGRFGKKAAPPPEEAAVGRSPAEVEEMIAADVQQIETFFCTYLRETSVRSRLLVITTLARLHGCGASDFVAAVEQAALNIPTLDESARCLD